MNKTLAIFVALTLVVSAVSIALVTDDVQAGKNRNNNKPPTVRGDDGAPGGGNGPTGGDGTSGNNGGDGQSGTGTNG